MLALVGRLGADTPVVLVLEDLHWADDSTLDVVAFLVNAAPVQRLLFLATYRSDEVRADDPLQRLAAGLVGRAAALPLALEPLPPEAVRALLVDGGEPLPDAVAAEIVARAEGNPFFAGELRAAAARGETALSPALRDVLLAKVAQLDGETRAVLRVAAAAGRDVSYALLAAVLPLGELELAEALRTAVEHGVLEPDHDTGSFRFRHALIAEAVRGTLLPGERELVHERLARALSEAPRLAAGGAAEEAHHWVAAGRPVEALEASLRAAREAERVSGLSEALRHVERVLELWESVPQAEELAGLALPSVLDWAAALVGSSSEESPALAVEEARRLYPSAVVLESLAVRVSPPFGAEAIAALRRANAAMLDARRDAVGGGRGRRRVPPPADARLRQRAPARRRAPDQARAAALRARVHGRPGADRALGRPARGDRGRAGGRRPRRRRPARAPQPLARAARPHRGARALSHARACSRPSATSPRNAYARFAPSGCMNAPARTSR